MPREKRTSKPKAAMSPQLYELEVALIDGMVAPAFAKANPHVLRTIQIRGDQTLADLHEAIFDAYDDWWHAIDVRAIEDDIPRGKYPKVTARTGASPPQYLDMDEDEDNGDDEDDE